jgi:RNA recognition motif-containing protein
MTPNCTGTCRFGKVKNCEVIRDQKTGDSLQYAFVEFYDQPACEQAYFKMDNVLIGGLIQNKKMGDP